MSHPPKTPEIDYSAAKVGDTVWVARWDHLDLGPARMYTNVYETGEKALEAANWRTTMENPTDLWDVDYALFAVAHTVTATGSDYTGPYVIVTPSWDKVVLNTRYLDVPTLLRENPPL